MLEKSQKRQVRHARIKAKFTGEKPRLVVFRSLKHIYAQLIDDVNGKTLVSASDAKIKTKGTKKEKAMAVGKALAEQALTKNIKVCAFDRGGYKYHGRVKELAEGARQGGLQF